jgi:hypothetical protein
MIGPVAQTQVMRVVMRFLGATLKVGSIPGRGSTGWSVNGTKMETGCRRSRSMAAARHGVRGPRRRSNPLHRSLAGPRRLGMLQKGLPGTGVGAWCNSGALWVAGDYRAFSSLGPNAIKPAVPVPPPGQSDFDNGRCS